MQLTRALLAVTGLLSASQAAPINGSVQHLETGLGPDHDYSTRIVVHNELDEAIRNIVMMHLPPALVVTQVDILEQVLQPGQTSAGSKVPFKADGNSHPYRWWQLSLSDRETTTGNATWCGSERSNSTMTSPEEQQLLADHNPHFWFPFDLHPEDNDETVVWTVHRVDEDTIGFRIDAAGSNRTATGHFGCRPVAHVHGKHVHGGKRRGGLTEGDKALRDVLSLFGQKSAKL